METILHDAHGRKEGFGTLKGRGNTLTLLRSDRVEWELKKAGTAKEIKSLLEAKKGKEFRGGVDVGMEEGERQRDDVDGEQTRRDGFERGVSIEAEFASVKAVGNFCRESVRNGNFKGNYNFNIKQQMEMRDFIERKGGKKEIVRIALIGGSQIGRLAKEMENGRGVRVVGTIRVKGKVDDRSVDLALDELAKLDKQPDKIVIGGPANSLVEHGDRGSRGFGPERKVIVKRTRCGTETELVTRYHMTEPRKIAMAERRDLVDRMVRLARGTQTLFPWAEVSYLTMFPRHVEPCYQVHMSPEDVWVMDGVRRDVDKDIVDMLEDGDDGVNVIEWWDVLGFETDMTVRETFEMRVVGSDGVHRTDRANRCAAVSLCDRYRVAEECWMDVSYRKRRRLI